jgi:hypothetical protein
MTFLEFIDRHWLFWGVVFVLTGSTVYDIIAVIARNWSRK